jgi:hypothetical protein
MRFFSTALLIAALTLASCTTTHVGKPREAPDAVSLVCIQENNRVVIDDILDVLDQGFLRNGIETRLFSASEPEDCSYVLTYTARRSWIGVPFMRYAHLRLLYEGSVIATATYTGGLDTNPYASNRDKLDPVIDELVSGF